MKNIYLKAILCVVAAKQLSGSTLERNEKSRYVLFKIKITANKKPLSNTIVHHVVRHSRQINQSIEDFHVPFHDSPRPIWQ